MYFGHHSLSLPQTWLLFQLAYRDCKRFVGLTQSSAASALPLLPATGANKTTPLHVGTSYTHNFEFYSVSELPTKLRGWQGGCAHFAPPLTGDTSFQNSLRARYLGQRAAKKTINVFRHFHGLIPDTHYKHLECFVMVGMHSLLCRVKCHINLVSVFSLEI